MNPGVWLEQITETTCAIGPLDTVRNWLQVVHIKAYMMYISPGKRADVRRLDRSEFRSIDVPRLPPRRQSRDPRDIWPQRAARQREHHRRCRWELTILAAQEVQPQVAGDAPSTCEQRRCRRPGRNRPETAAQMRRASKAMGIAQKIVATPVKSTRGAQEL